MTREEALSVGLIEIERHKCIVAELTTSFGKTALAINLANKVCDRVWRNEQDAANILILVPTQPLRDNDWPKEIEKWGGFKTDNVKIECYNSLEKYKRTNWDIVICDEAQHLSDARKDMLKTIHIDYNLICLSATLPKSTKDWIRSNYNTYVIKETAQNAIDEGTLPEPTIYLMPLNFDEFPTECIKKNTGKGYPIVKCNYKDRWIYLRKNGIEIHIHCTKRQYLDDLNSQIQWYKNRAMKGNEWAKLKWLRLCNDRLKWLAQCKNSTVLSLLDKTKNHRTLTFCASIEQSEVLGKNCIHSKNKLAKTILDKFNNKKIDHITACDMLNEGCNLTECQIGIFANINASDIRVIQRIGRILRHKKPIIIMLYYKNTREEELVKKHLEGYNPDLIKVVNKINEIRL